MLERALDMVDLEGAADAALLLSRRQHEMLEDELAAPGEEIAQAHLSLRGVEEIWLLDPDPGQLPALGAQPVAQPRHLLLSCKMCPTGDQPFLAGYDPVLHDVLLGGSETGQIIGQVFEGAVPAPAMQIAGSLGVEDRLVEMEL